jgi:hypothetical protein
VRRARGFATRRAAAWQNPSTEAATVVANVESVCRFPAGFAPARCPRCDRHAIVATPEATVALGEALHSIATP